VIVAKREAIAAGLGHLQIGFNWANHRSRGEREFWRSLRRMANLHGVGTLKRSVDWVGLDLYPGTWGPWVAGPTLYSGARRTTVDALKAMRERFLPAAGLRREPLHVSEVGYPTGPGRSESMQVSVLLSVTRTIHRRRAEFGVTDLRWFNLRDSDSSSSSFERRYGLMRDDYSPKPAFGTFKRVVTGG
jgi:hypothetical protein